MTTRETRTAARREAAGEITLASLARIPGLGTARPVRPLTDAELYERHVADEYADVLGPCRCHACERHLASLRVAS